MTKKLKYTDDSDGKLKTVEACVMSVDQGGDCIRDFFFGEEAGIDAFCFREAIKGDWPITCLWMSERARKIFGAWNSKRMFGKDVTG